MKTNPGVDLIMAALLFAGLSVSAETIKPFPAPAKPIAAVRPLITPVLKPAPVFSKPPPIKLIMLRGALGGPARQSIKSASVINGAHLHK